MYVWNESKNEMQLVCVCGNVEYLEINIWRNPKQNECFFVCLYNIKIYINY